MPNGAPSFIDRVRLLCPLALEGLPLKTRPPAQCSGASVSCKIALRCCLERLRMDRDPDSGRRVSRLNRKSAWHEGNVPRLEVVSAVPQDDVIHRLGAGGL